MVYGLGRLMNTVRLGVVLHVKFFLGIVVEWLRLVKLNNVLDGGVVKGRTGPVERMVGSVVFVVRRQRVLRKRKMVVDDVWIRWRDENTAQLSWQQAVVQSRQWWRGWWRWWGRRRGDGRNLKLCLVESEMLHHLGDDLVSEQTGVQVSPKECFTQLSLSPADGRLLLSSFSSKNQVWLEA